jgi:hypothetical protein
MFVVACKVPDEVPVEVPWMVIVDVPVVAEPEAMSDNTLELVVGLTLHDAVTPVDIPDAVRVTGPVNPPTSVTLTVSVPPEFRLIVIADAVGAIVKLPVPEDGVNITAMLTDLLTAPEVTVTTAVKVPGAAVLLAVKVINQVVVVGWAIVTVTPEGRPETEILGVAVAPVTVMVQVALPPCCKVNPLPQDAETLKPAVTASVKVVVAVNVPEVPVRANTRVPGVAVLGTVIVSTQLPFPMMGLLHPEIVTGMGLVDCPG